MNLFDLRCQIDAYAPPCEQERNDKAALLSAIDTEEHILTRENVRCHFTASGWIVNPARDRVLMAYHNIYNAWSWTGGHADGEADLLAVALREAAEETGLLCVQPVRTAPFSLEVLTVDGHIKRGSYVSSHLHLNLTYLLEADDCAPLSVKADENKAVRWFHIDEAAAASTEAWMRQWVYEKLNRRLRAL